MHTPKLSLKSEHSRTVAVICLLKTQLLLAHETGKGFQEKRKGLIQR